MPYKVNLTPPRPGHIAVRKIPSGWLVVTPVRSSFFPHPLYQVGGYYTYGFMAHRTAQSVARKLMPAVRAHHAAEHDHAEACS